MIGERLPELTVELLDGSSAAVGRHPQDGTVCVVPHADCAACRRLGDALEGRAEIIGWWGARIVTTRDERLRSALGLDPEQAAVVVLDRFGVVWELHTATPDDHADLPDADAVEESAKFLGTQCPECGVLDRPDDGAWATI